jgi:rhodanese-related sulfurtransferase
MAGAWLRLMGHRFVSVVDGDLPMTEAGSGARHLESLPKADEISVDELAKAKDLVVVDLARSIDFRRAHIPGAVWGVRTRLRHLPQLVGAKDVVVTSPDGVVARLAVDEIKGLGARVRTLAGGTQAWISGGHGTEASRFNPDDDDCIDFYLRPFDRNHRVTEAMHEYLLWEVDLVKEIERDGTVHFGANR